MTTFTDRPTDPLERRQYDAKMTRVKAAELSADAQVEPTTTNADEKHPFLFSFTKGLEHQLNGILSDPDEFLDFAVGTEFHDPNPFAEAEPFRRDFYTDRANGKDDEAGEKFNPYREWESPTAGHAFVLEGPDPQAIPMPPAPKVGSTEFAAEIAEVYQMALCRDWCLAAFMPHELIDQLAPIKGKTLPDKERKAIKAQNKDVVKIAERLGDLRWFKGETLKTDTGEPLEQARRRFGQAPTENTIFRGLGEDSGPTPFISQFMIMGSGGGSRDFDARASGRVAFGAQTVDQKVNIAIPEKDYMTTWLEYVDVQNGANVRRKNQPSETIQAKTRPIATLRDMATYVHDDALYQAYLNAALILLDEGFATDPGIPYHKDSSISVALKSNREPFALFGGPHLLTLVTEVSSRALKAVRFQKFTRHRRFRPEAAGAMLHTVLSGYKPHRDLEKDPDFKGHIIEAYDLAGSSKEAIARRRLASTVAHYVDTPGTSTTPGEPALYKILEEIRLHNAKQNKAQGKEQPDANWLLPMAFAEGSPMHPAYGAGHATVAGACVTLLKAFFAMKDEHQKPVYLVKPHDNALVPGCPSGDAGKEDDVDLLALPMPEGLTLQGELNKLIWNISNARNIGGVHYYTDYIESALLGEAITIGILREQMLCYHPEEKVTMTVPLITKRKLPKALLSGQSTLTEHDEVQTIRIRSNGAIERLS